MARPAFIPLAAGLQTELEDQLVQPGATLLLENCYSPQTGKTSLRFGADILSTASQATLPSGGTLPTPWQFATLDGALVRFNRAPVPLHVWAPDAGAWVRPSADGGLTSYRRGPIKLTTAPVFAGTQAGDTVSDPDIAYGSGAIVFVCQVSNQGTTKTVVTILDEETRKPVFTRRTAASTRAPRVVIVGNIAVVAYEAGGALQVDSYNLNTYALSQQVTLGNVTSGIKLDMRAGSPVAGANNVAILYRENSAGELRLATVDATNLTTNSTITPRTTAGAAVAPDLGFGWMQDFGASGKFAVMIADTTDGLRTLWDLPAPTAGNSDAVATHVLDAAATAAPSGATAGIRNIIGTTTGSGATGVYRVMYEVTAPSRATRATIKSAGRDSGIISVVTSFRSVGIRSKIWSHGGNFYFLSAFAGVDQKSYFVLSTAGTSFITSDPETFPAPLAVAFPRGAGGLSEAVNAPSAVATGPAGQLFMAVTHEIGQEASVLPSGTGTGVTAALLATDIVEVIHPAAVETQVGKPAEFIRSLFTPGGLLGQFDGSTYATAGFAYYPPDVPVFAAAQTGGNLTASSTYRYRWLYSFRDRNGRKWRSAPSTPVSASTNGTDFQFLINLDTLRLIDRGLVSGTDGYQIELYRTLPGATEGYFLVASIFNDPTVDTIQVTDNVSDASLGEQIYTDGGGLENQLPPAFSCVVEHQGRLVALEAGTGTLWYTLEVDLTSGLLFNEALTLDVADPSEAGTGLAVYGQQLFVFKAGKIYAIDGQGANALGQGASYNFRQIDGGTGCSNPQSIVVAPDGVWFRSSSERAGIHKTSGGVAEYVGGGVRAHNGLTITAAVVVRHLTQIRFLTHTGTTFVWDWTSKLWSTNTGQACITACVGMDGVTGVVYARSSDSFVLSEADEESAAPYVEAGTAYKGKGRTPWYQISGLAGFERIKRIQGVGDAGAAHTAVIRLYRNQNGTTPFQTRSKAFTGDEVRWNWEVRPSVQKLSSLMVEFEIDNPDGTAGPGIVGVSLIPKTKEGMDKLGSSRRGT